MDQKEKITRDYLGKDYKVFKGISIRPQKIKKQIKQHFIVPWQLQTEKNVP